MKFSTGNEMFDYLQSGKDLYSPSEEIYVFLYSDLGSVCTYSISNERANTLKEMEGYWGGHLGMGGRIYDSEDWYKENKESKREVTAEQWCEMNYCCDWIETPYREEIEWKDLLSL